MDFMKAFMDQNMIAMMGEIVLFANTVAMAMPTGKRIKRRNGIEGWSCCKRIEKG